MGVCFNALDKVTTLKRFLPPSNRKRGLLDLGGGVLKVLFGTATVQDINSLHHTLDELHKKQEEVPNSVEQQVTYFTHLTKDVQFNYMAVSNLSNTLKDFATRTEETFQEVSSKSEWAFKQRLAASVISELEFSITQLGVNVEEWLEALQYIMSGKVPINLISPKLLGKIITSVTLGLPEGYELAAGMRPDSLTWYYQDATNCFTYGCSRAVNSNFDTVKRYEPSF
jgi:uncharacterized protein YoxC